MIGRCCLTCLLHTIFLNLPVWLVHGCLPSNNLPWCMLTPHDVHLQVAVVSLFVGFFIGLSKVAEPIIQTTIARFPIAG